MVEVPEDLAEHKALLRAHEEVYNNVRPQQALGYLTPNEFLARCQGRPPLKGGKVSRIY